MGKLDLDLPLEGTPASRFLFWVTAGLVYVAVIAFTIAALADVQLRALANEPRIVTVALPPNPDRAAGRLELQAILSHLRELPGVAYASLVDDAEIDSLVEPWLGMAGRAGGDPGGGAVGMPLPRLIDVAYNPGANVDIPALDRALDAIVEGATVGDAGLLQRSQERLAAVLRLVGTALGLTLIATLLAAVAWLTRLSFGQHRQTVDLLRQMGARDGYIARQLEHHALIKGLRGAALGFATAIATASIVLHGPQAFGRPAVTDQPLAPLHWVLLAIVPVATALAIAMTARIAALFALARRR